jgi:CHAD domain-containing protein
MNSPQPAAGAQPHNLRDRVAVWRELLEQCGRKPTRKRVHALRVVTLRIQAEVEYEVSELPQASHQAQAMLRFGKQAEKLRGALGSVRELDVWIAKLGRLRGSLGKPAAYIPRSTQECIRQIERLEARLMKKRRVAGQKLITQIAKRRWDLLGASDDIEELASDGAAATDGGAAGMILKQFEGVVVEFPAFNEENLHEFRKRIKKVRYLAEIRQNAEPLCAQIVAVIKKLQTAIGEWHDWQILAQTSHEDRHSYGVEAGELLDSLVAESYEAAVAACYAGKARMAELQSGLADSGDGVQRKPPMRTGGLAARTARNSA